MIMHEAPLKHPRQYWRGFCCLITSARIAPTSRRNRATRHIYRPPRLGIQPVHFDYPGGVCSRCNRVLSVIVDEINRQSQCWSIAGYCIFSSRNKGRGPLVNVCVGIKTTERNIDLLTGLNDWIKVNA